MYNLPLEENTKSNCNEHFNTKLKKKLKKLKLMGPKRRRKITIGLLIIIIIENK
jgi:hypothetical protein